MSGRADTGSQHSANYPARAVIDLSAIADNVRALCAATEAPDVMAVVKADAYGHGILPVAKTALAAGATWLGTAQASEALQLRAAGIGPDQARILTWLHAPGAPFADLIAADIDVSVAADWDLEAVAQAARQIGKPANIHIKLDTGLGRNGVMPEYLPAFARKLAALQAEGVVNVVGLWSHLAYADEPGHPFIQTQREVFDAAIKTLAAAGIDPEFCHIANSAATLTAPELHYDLVRPGISLYGYSPVPAEAPPSAFGLRPAMTLQAGLATVKDVGSGRGVSYSHRYHTEVPTRLGVVPLGYADGIERHASGGIDGIGGPVLSGDRLLRVAGRVCMDQFVVDLGPDAPEQAGDVVTLFGDSDGLAWGAKVPNAEDWASAANTISYVITTQLGPRVPRVYVGAA